MDSFLEWVKTLDWGNICAAIWTFICVYGVSLFTLVIGILKLKTKNANFIEQLEKLQLVLEDEYNKKLEDLKENLNISLELIQGNIIETNTKLNQEKIEAVNKAVEVAKESVEKLDPIEEFNIEEILDEVGD
ncbi:MAG: hypothetical protein NC087_01955 [Anaeroplasma bactoclasticum]|nr:hypothetical protein [Anaeroplasma bactoclasticum]